MSTAWKGLTKSYKTPSARTGEAFGIKGDEDILKFCETLITNDLKEEYYYSMHEVAMDTFKIHENIFKRNPKLYAEIVKTLRNVSLECQKVIASLHLWKTDRNLAKELLGDVRPTWKLAFFYALRKAPDYAKIPRGWGRTIKAMIRDTIKNTSPYIIMKYASKLKPLVALAHLKEDEKTLFIFKKNKARDILEKTEFKDYFILKDAVKTGNITDIIKALKSISLPYTVALGILGKYNKNPSVLKHLIRLMTPWETILNLRKMQNANIDFNDPEILKQIQEKLNPEKLRDMKIDPVELFQAYTSIKVPVIKVLLRIIIDNQVKSIGEGLAKNLEGLNVAVVFDCSGSMDKVFAWSMMIAYAISSNIKNAKIIAFSNEPYLVSMDMPLLEKMEILRKDERLWEATALGKALISALQFSPDIIFFISDFEGNIEPWSDDVYKEYVKQFGKFPKVVSIKFTTSPWTAIGEPTAIRTGRWLGIPEEIMISLRNLWDLPNILEYLFNLLPLLKKRGLLKTPPVGVL